MVKNYILQNLLSTLGPLIDLHLNWSYHTKSLSSKLNRASGMLSKIRHYVDKKSLVNVYYASFSSILSYERIIGPICVPVLQKSIFLNSITLFKLSQVVESSFFFNCFHFLYCYHAVRII